MYNLSWTPHSSLEKDNSLNHSCVSARMVCLAYISKIVFLWMVVYSTKHCMGRREVYLPQKSGPRNTFWHASI